MTGADGVPAEEPEPVESGTGTPDEGSGDPRVDEVIARLEGVTERPGAEQVADYESAHRVLQDTLATIDET